MLLCLDVESSNQPVLLPIWLIRRRVGFRSIWRM